MTEDSLKFATRRHKQKISKNQLLDKEEYESDKGYHQTSVWSLIYSTIVNGGRPKGLTLKNKKNFQERIYEAKLHITRLLLEEKKNFQRLPTGTFHLLPNYAMANYDLH